MKEKIEKRIKANRIVGYIAFREHFSSHPHRHSWDLCGHPMYYWKLRAANEAEHLEKIIIFTDNKEARKMARTMSEKFVIIERTIEECREPEWETIDDLKTSKSRQSIYKPSIKERIIEALDFEPTLEVTLQANSPLEKSVSIDQLIEIYFEDDRAETAYLVYKVEGYLWTKDPGNPQYLLPIWDFHSERDRWKFPPLYRLSGSHIHSYGWLEDRNRAVYVEIPPEEGVEIHDERDLELARFYLEKQLQENP